MYVHSYKINNSYTIYVNPYYLSDCAQACKKHTAKKEELADIERRVKKALQTQYNPKKHLSTVAPLKPNSFVAHKQFGKGKVISTDVASGIIRVNFDGDIRRFLFPDAMEQGYKSYSL